MSRWTTRATLLALALVLFGAQFELAAQTPLTAEDHAEIRMLYAKYNHALDFGDAEAWADTFVEDGTFMNFEGREALIGFATNFYDGQEGYSRHWNSQLILEPTADGASGATYLMLWSTRTRPPAITTTGVYRDQLVRTPDGWRFLSRNVEADSPAPAQE